MAGSLACGGQVFKVKGFPHPVNPLFFNLAPPGEQDRDQLRQDGQEDGHEEAEEQHVESADQQPGQVQRGTLQTALQRERL